jgi:hypothetical protein
MATDLDRKAAMVVHGAGSSVGQARLVLRKIMDTRYGLL